jgi:hypothetical protein
MLFLILTAFAVTVCDNGTRTRPAIDNGTAPSAPQNFTAVPGDGQVSLTWTAPANNGGSEILKYEVSSGSTWIDRELNTAHTFTGLTNGISYTFRVRAVNANGVGQYASVTATPEGLVELADFIGLWKNSYNVTREISTTKVIAAGDGWSFEITDLIITAVTNTNSLTKDDYPDGLKFKGVISNQTGEIVPGFNHETGKDENIVNGLVFSSHFYLHTDKKSFTTISSSVIYHKQ